jgi:hypothetical protein
VPGRRHDRSQRLNIPLPQRHLGEGGGEPRLLMGQPGLQIGQPPPRIAVGAGLLHQRGQIAGIDALAEPLPLGCGRRDFPLGSRRLGFGVAQPLGQHLGALDQLARRRDLRPVRRDRQDLRDGFGAKGPQQRGKPRGALPGFGLVRGQIAMVGGDPVARPFERVDALPRRQQPLVRLFRGQLPEEAVEPVRRGPALQRSQSDRLPGLPPSASGIGRQARRRLRRRQFPLGRLPLLKPRAHALDALQPRDRGLTRRLFAGQRRPPIARAVAFALQLLPIPRPHRRGAQRGARLAERGERLIQGPRPRLPLRRQRVAPALEAFAQAAQAGDAAAGGEQRLGEIAAGSQHRFGAAAQQMAVEREQALEQRLVGLSDQPLEDARIKAVAGAVDQRVAEALAPADRKGGAAAIDPLGEEAHARIAEAERHPGLAGDAEQQIAKGLAQDRFAPAVRGDDQVDVARQRIEGEPHRLKIPVILERERGQAHRSDLSGQSRQHQIARLPQQRDAALAQRVLGRKLDPGHPLPQPLRILAQQIGALLADQFIEHRAEPADDVRALEQSGKIGRRDGIDDDRLDPDRIVGAALPALGDDPLPDALAVAEQFSMQRRRPEQPHPRRHGPVLRLPAQLQQGLADAGHGAVEIGFAGQRDRKRAPAQYVERPMRDRRDAPVANGNKTGPFRPAFPDMPPLQISREHDPGIAAYGLARMNMAERPVIIPLGDQRRGRGRRVGVVAGPAVERRMQQADIEQAGHGVGVIAA